MSKSNKQNALAQQIKALSGKGGTVMSFLASRLSVAFPLLAGLLPIGVRGGRLK